MWVTISMREIVGGVVRHHDLVVKMKIAKFFPAVFVIRENLCSQNFSLYSISPHCNMQRF